MAFEFVIETPRKRGINRNNNKIIQKRATQAGARTRSARKPTREHSCSDRSMTALPGAKADRPDAAALLTNAQLAFGHNSPFMVRFGSYGQALYVPDSIPTADHACVGVRDPTFSILQRHLLDTIIEYPAAEDPTRLFKIMSLTQKQFLVHLPSHYGGLAFLDQAIECLVARLHQVVPLVKCCSASSASDAQFPTKLYAKALRSLREAIDEDVGKVLPYIWFAIMLLILFELLSGEDEPGWLWHAAGAARLLYKVGPENINSEFHMSLLASQSRVMVVETILTNKNCYLADPAWQRAIRRTCLDCEDFADRSEVSTDLWTIGARVPNLFMAISEIVHGDSKTELHVEEYLLRRIIKDFVDWKHQWLHILTNLYHNIVNEDKLRYQSLRILQAYYMLVIITYRLEVAFHPWRSRHLEDEAQAASADMFDLRQSLSLYEWSIRKHSSVYTKVACATQRTASKWMKEVGLATPNATIDSQTFDEWCAMIGRVVDVHSSQTLLDEQQI